ncbi:DUF4252 domain-containing protein [Bacteroides sp. 224]|uniref:DUF4252 domain-containing protein n=1 Tax=Bacteroides sp. 224 TaxID=2302936 RepID=UPI0013D69B98|nr:DUF4252 domain-containing protein [Bacteroides sp. 224]NDV66590.1 DUF4252 domain-containing protein [Bacteroides sp. 224]
MKKILLLLGGLALWTSVCAQDIVADFQQKYEKDASFSCVNITKKMFQLIGAMANTDEQGIINDLDGLRVLNSSQNSQSHYKNALAMMNKSGFEELVSIEEAKEKTQMFTKESKGVISSLVIITENEGEFSMIGIFGKVDLKKISSLANSMNVEGLKALENIPDKKKK